MAARRGAARSARATKTRQDENAHREDERSLPGHCGLLTQAELLDQRTVSVNVRALKIIKELPALTHQFKQAAPRVMILTMRLKVLGQPINSLS